MSDVNIRGVDVTHVKSWKHAAVESGQTLKEWVVETLNRNSEVGDGEGQAGAGRIKRVRAGRSSSGVRKSGAKERDRGHAAVPVLSKAESQAVELRPLLPVRPELGVGGQSGPSSAQPGESHEGHAVYGKGTGHWCADCKIEF